MEAMTFSPYVSMSTIIFASLLAVNMVYTRSTISSNFFFTPKLEMKKRKTMSATSISTM